MLGKKGKPFRSGINAGILRDRETLVTKRVCSTYSDAVGKVRHTMNVNGVVETIP